MARDKTTITLDRVKAEYARSSSTRNRSPMPLTWPLDRLIFEAQVEREVFAYRLQPQGGEERRIARRQPRRKFDDDPTDWEAFYANRKRRPLR